MELAIWSLSAIMSIMATSYIWMLVKVTGHDRRLDKLEGHGDKYMGIKVKKDDADKTNDNEDGE